MEEISVRKVAHVILLAREIDRGEGELRGVIDQMTEEEQAALVAIMWIGRDAFDADEWAEAYATAVSEASTPTADYLIGTPHVADHLEAGLEALGYDSSDEEDELLRRGA
ncbi:DUF3775 domain-containing protein [Salipiger abyssi]|uniref:Putative DUF3775 protein n=1 Tax=Salipiger abyssi TaxID=1250539 RepID=A0A1P8USM7_9RHOB|nr:DUF3775 domain-containing protein [Salipiger abyssi]APZ52338.1 putative DUF3775 protein [Salipiger abyssi]MBN9889921.1 DUF3775 domain-containing protein [Salipiger abyssi]